MEDMLKKQNLGGSTNNFATPTPSSPATALGMHKNSQIIGKVKPKIRIIHIFAPEIIKTDAANFRELVQRLTGKPTENKKTSPMISKKRQRNSTSVLPIKSIDPSPSFSTATDNFTHHRLHHDHQHHPMMILHKPFATKMELRSGFLTGAEFRERIKGEQEIWRNANSGGGFLGGFTELEGFMEQLNHEYPLLLPTVPMEAAHDHMDAYGQSQHA